MAYPTIPPKQIIAMGGWMFIGRDAYHSPIILWGPTYLKFYGLWAKLYYVDERSHPIRLI
jgi:hypothetical protein